MVVRKSLFSIENKIFSPTYFWLGPILSEVQFKKLDSFTSETSKNHLIRNFLRNERLRVKLKVDSIKCWLDNTGGLCEDHFVLICYILTFFYF